MQVNNKQHTILVGVKRTLELANFEVRSVGSEVDDYTVDEMLFAPWRYALAIR